MRIFQTEINPGEKYEHSSIFILGVRHIGMLKEGISNKRRVIVCYKLAFLLLFSPSLGRFFFDEAANPLGNMLQRPHSHARRRREHTESVKK